MGSVVLVPKVVLFSGECVYQYAVIVQSELKERLGHKVRLGYVFGEPHRIIVDHAHGSSRIPVGIVRRYLHHVPESPQRILGRYSLGCIIGYDPNVVVIPPNYFGGTKSHHGCLGHDIRVGERLKEKRVRMACRQAPIQPVGALRCPHGYQMWLAKYVHPWRSTSERRI